MTDKWLQKEEWSKETMACHRNEDKPSYDRPVIIIWSGIVSAITASIIALIGGHMEQVIGSWLFAFSIFMLWYSLDVSRCWRAFAWLLGGAVGCLLGSWMITGSLWAYVAEWWQ